jgi:hypothetical protein
VPASREESADRRGMISLEHEWSGGRKRDPSALRVRHHGRRGCERSRASEERRGIEGVAPRSQSIRFGTRRDADRAP